MTPHDFVTMIAPWAQKDWRERRILLPSVKIAQACLETGYGSSVPNNNMFGVKGDGDAYQTEEFINGKWITITVGFQHYESWEQSVYGQSDFLVVNKRYRPLIGLTVPQSVCNWLQSVGYATDPRYAPKLLAIIESLDLRRYDAMLDAGVAQTIINTWIAPAWHATDDQQQRDYIHWLANQLREAAGLEQE